MGLKLAGARLLHKGGLLNRTNYIAVMSSATAEFADSWYRRRAMALAAWTRTNAGLASNTEALEFPTPMANAALAPSHFGIYSAATAGTLYATQALTGSPLAPAQNASFGFDAGDLELALATGAVTGRGLRRAFESGIVSGTTYVGLFERQPSGNNPGAIDDRVGVAEAGWVENSAAMNNVRNSAAVEFGIQATNEPRPLWVGLFDAATAGNLLWEDQFDATPADPEAQARLTIPANTMSIGFTIDAS